jgi:hypothetical protein
MEQFSLSPNPPPALHGQEQAHAFSLALEGCKPLGLLYN